MHYRLAWRSPAEIAPFANSRWAAAPAELVRKQLLRASGEGGKCRLDLELQEFTQVFASAQASEARIELRASLVHAAGSSSRSVTVVEPNAGADAASGAAAFVRATDRAVGELGAWIAAQTACR